MIDLTKLNIEAIRDALVAGARKAGVSVEEHAAAELHALEAKYGRAVIIGVFCAFFVGFVLGKLV
jgi:hypothetical protein